MFKTVNMKVFIGVFCKFSYAVIPYNSRNYVVFQEVTGNTGRSVTDCANEIATYVIQNKNLDPSTCVFIEYSPNDKSEFYVVTYKWLMLSDKRLLASHSQYKLPLKNEQALFKSLLQL